MEGCTVNTLAEGYEATHPDYPGKVGKGKTPQAAIDNLDKIKGRKRKPGGGEGEEAEGTGEEPKL